MKEVLGSRFQVLGKSLKPKHEDQLLIKSYRKFLVSIFAILVAFFLFTNLALAAGGLVPCGNDLNSLCTTCDFFKLFDNVKNFLLFKIIPPVGVLFVIIAGFFILTAGANPSNYTKGKKILTDLVWGLLIIFGAWMITNTVIKLLASESDISSNWYSIECTATGITPGGGPTPTPATTTPQKFKCNASNECVVDPTGTFPNNTCGGTCKAAVTPTPTKSTLPPTGDAQSLAQQILAKGNITLATSHPSGVRDNATAKQNVVDTVAGKSAARSCYGQAPCGTIQLSSRMLAGLLFLANQFSISVSEIAGGSHSSGSQHYRGTGFDINYAGGQHLTCSSSMLQKVIQACKDAGATFVNNECSVNHVHCDWR